MQLSRHLVAALVARCWTHFPDAQLRSDAARIGSMARRPQTDARTLEAELGAGGGGSLRRLFGVAPHPRQSSAHVGAAEHHVSGRLEPSPPRPLSAEGSLPHSPTAVSWAPVLMFTTTSAPRCFQPCLNLSRRWNPKSGAQMPPR